MTLQAWLYKWLPIFFGCHCRDDRSFHWHGRKFPICARCTGELAGMILAVGFLWHLPPVWLAAVLLVPLVVDGFVQLLTPYESTNPRRFVTGLAFGFGFLTLFVHSCLAAYRFGYSLTH